FYIFTAVILCTYLFSLVSVISQKTEESDKFEILKENYVKESSEAINSAVYNKGDVSDQLDDFSTNFIDYAKTKGIDLEMLTIVVQDDIEINNYLNGEAQINNNVLNKGQNLIIDKTDQITVEAYGNEYVFDMSDEPLQLKGMLRTQKDSNIQVHIIQ
ncbi:hypothetical protein DRJ17_06530, partial [Candidatus Woesearchaeota archaeon]